MHPEEVQISGALDGIIQEQNLKPQELVEDDIDVEKVDNGDLHVAQVKEHNGNGFHLKENGHSDQLEVKGEKISKEKEFIHELSTLNGVDGKSVLRLKSTRRNSTSSRSSSVSSAPSVKDQSPVALQMEVSMDEDDKEHMEPLIIEGAAEDLEVSKCVPHIDADHEADAVTTDSETVPTEYDEESWQGFETEELVEQNKVSKSGKRMKTLKSPPKPKSAGKVKTPRTKSLKLKAAKLSPKVMDSFSDQPPNDFDAEYSDSNSAMKDDSEVEEVNVKSLKSPSKRSRSTMLKQDLPLEETEGDDKSDTELAPRRSSRARQTPQKYNSSLYADTHWDYQALADDRLNNSDAAALGIRSVKGRRSLRKSRNISALNASLHNESSPWESDFKVLTPCGGGLSVHDNPAENKDDSSTPLKRKANDEDDHGDDERGTKKLCVENADLDNSVSSHTSSFFSVITSPILLLKNKLRGSSVSSSTPIKSGERKDIDSVSVMGSDSITLPENEIAAPALDEKPAVAPAVAPAQEVRSWCTIM